MKMKMKMGATTTSSMVMVLLCLVSAISSSTAQPFSCNSTRRRTCNAIVDYLLPNTTTLSAVQALFNVPNLRSLLGANSLPPSTPRTLNLSAATTIKIPFPCICTNGTGKSNRRPFYTVIPGDGLFHIAAEVFSGLVTFQQIQAANNISDPNLIEIGQRLWIPLPCSCDDVDGQRVVHYGHVVANGSSVEGIAEQYNTTQDTLLRLNGLATPNQLQAGAILDVPLRACTSMVSDNSLDYPLLVSNGTYVFTATNCVTCKCDAANNWTLQCEPTQLNSSAWQSCPSMQCQGPQTLFLGNTTSSNCNRTTCAYAGYTNQTILTTLASESTCPASGDNSSAVSLQGWKWNILMISVHLLLLCIHNFH